MTILTDEDFFKEWDTLSAAISNATTANEKKTQAGAALKTLKQMARDGKLTRFQHLSAAVDVVELVPVNARKSIITAVYNESRQCGSHPIVTDSELLQILTRLSDATRHVKQAPTGPTRTALRLAASLYEAGDCTSTDWKKATHAILDSRNTGVDTTLLDVLSDIDRQLPDNAMGVKETLDFKEMVIAHIEDEDLRSSQAVLLYTEMHDAYLRRKLTLDDYLSAAQYRLPYGCNAAAIDVIVFNAQRVAIDACQDGSHSRSQSLQVQNKLAHHLKDASRFNRVTLNFLDSELSNHRLTLGAYLKSVVTAFDGLSTEVRAEIAPQFMARTGQYILSGSPEGNRVYLEDQSAVMSPAQRNNSAFSAQIAAYPDHLRESAVDQAWAYIEQAQESGLLSSDVVIACQRSLLWRRQGDQSASMHRPHPVAAPVLNMFNQAAAVIANAAATQVFFLNRQALYCLSSLLSYEAVDDGKLYKVPITGYEALVDAAVPVMAGLVNSDTVRDAFNFITEHDPSPDTLARHGIFVYDGPANVLGGKRDNGGLEKMRFCALFNGISGQDPVLILRKEKTPFLVFPLSEIEKQKFTQGERIVVNAVLEQAKLQPQY